MLVPGWHKLCRDVSELPKEQEEGNNTINEVALKHFIILLYQKCL